MQKALGICTQAFNSRKFPFATYLTTPFVSFSLRACDFELGFINFTVLL
jgi:hypothetical protein